jgi:hypothetical protein
MKNLIYVVIFPSSFQSVIFFISFHMRVVKRADRPKKLQSSIHNSLEGNFHNISNVSLHSFFSDLTLDDEVKYIWRERERVNE